MCTGGDGIPGSAGEAVEMMDAALGFLGGAGGEAVEASALGELLTALAGIDAKHTAMRLRLIARFDANDGHDADGYQTTGSWLAGKTRATPRQARAEARQARQMAAHPGLLDAVSGGGVSASWAGTIAGWTAKLPSGDREEVERLLLEAAAAGASLDDLFLLFTAAWEAWQAANPPPDDGDDGFGDRYTQLDLTFGGAGRLTGDLTPECAAALQAVLEALGKKCGKEDTRTAGQRFHDALQEACELLIGAKMVPDRAGADTHVDVQVALSQLLDMPGADTLTEAWLRARAGEHGYLAGKDAEVVACDALIVPVVTGSPDWNVIEEMVDVVLAAFGRHGAPGRADEADAPGADGSDDGASVTGRGGPLPPEAWEALQYALARLAIGFVSGPGALASVLRTGLLPAPFNTKSFPLDVGYSDRIPETIRRAVILRDAHCAWPGGCDRRPAQCDVHHTKHKKDGGPTSVALCALFCDFHHDVCIHRWGWKVELLPDGSVRATSPDGQVLRSHGPPPARGG
ncbi:MAG: DUF222 domain-containing protein [Trebonia sp.]